MNRIAMSPVAAALLRALVNRAGVERDRILLTDLKSTDWRSLTFSGERHVIDLRIVGNAADAVAARICDGLGDAEFSIPGQIVADIAEVGTRRLTVDGSALVSIEALTIEE